MLPSNKTVDWPSFWADLLRGVSTGLLEHDGSRISRAALAGLNAFDTAQERRRRSQESHVTLPWLEMSDAERAAFLRLRPDLQAAFSAEWADAELQDDPHAYHSHSRMEGGESIPGYHAMRRQPMSASPFEGWATGSALPFGSDGRLNIPTFRR